MKVLIVILQALEILVVVGTVEPTLVLLLVLDQAAVLLYSFSNCFNNWQKSLENDASLRSRIMVDGAGGGAESSHGGYDGGLAGEENFTGNQSLIPI